MPASRHEEKEEELNLVPIMNLVLILIPLLLLSVVFLEVSVINVTMPQKSLGPATTDGEPPKRLQVMVSKEGFWIITDPSMKPEPPISRCSSGPGGQQVTICLLDQNAETPTVDSYDWQSLYNELMTLKDNAHWQDHETIELVAGSEIPFGILVKAMDLSRFQRVAAGTEGAKKGETFASVDDMNASALVMVDVTDEKTGESGVAPLGLFPLVVLGVPAAQ